MTQRQLQQVTARNQEAVKVISNVKPQQTKPEVLYLFEHYRVQ